MEKPKHVDYEDVHHRRQAGQTFRSIANFYGVNIKKLWQNYTDKTQEMRNRYGFGFCPNGHEYAVVGRVNNTCLGCTRSWRNDKEREARVLAHQARIDEARIQLEGTEEW